MIKVIAVLMGSMLLMGAAGPVTCSQQYSDVALTSLDAICDNLSTADAAFQALVPVAHISANSQRIERDAVAAVSGICSQRPVSNPSRAFAAASAAFAKVLAAEASARRLVVDSAGG
jgi:hypothetical protein